MALGNIRVILEILGRSGGAEGAADRVRGKIDKLNVTVRQAQKRTSAFGTGLRDLSTGFRMLGQAALNLGMTFSMLVGIPLAIALKGGAEAAISFEHMMVRVQKTTGLLRDGLAELGQGLLQLGRYTATPTDELAKISEVAGQMGFRAPAAIMRVVEITNMLAVATEMTAEQSARSLGKIASAWGFLGDKAAAVFGPLGNTINQLENRFNATAGEIVNGMLRASSAAAMLEISMADTAAMVTTLVSAGESAQTSGTMLNRIFVTMVQNIDTVAAALGTTEQALKQRLGRDSIGVITDFLDYLGRVPGVADRLGLSMEVAGWRGGRGLAHLTTGSELLSEAMTVAGNEFESGTSLIDEYNKAMESTQNQLAILKNNLRVAAITIGDVLLPKINDLIQIAVPAIQRLVSAFVELPKKTQLIIMGVVALSTILGPLLVLFGSLAFSIGMTGGALVSMARGIIGLGGSLLSITSVVGKLASVLLGFLPVGGGLITMFGTLAPLILAVGSAIAIGLIAATDQGQQVLENLSQVIESYVDAAQSWGEGLMSNLAIGILNAANWVIEACIAIGETIASFFAAASAPETGPLSQIGQWGKRLIDTYLQAFKTADFSVLETVGRRIRRYFENLATAGMIDETDIVPKTAKAREKIAEIIAAFNETGIVAEDKMAQLRDMLGEAGDEVERLLRLQLEYNAAQAVIEGAQERKKAIGDQYQAEVAAIRARGDLTDEEKRAAISAAFERARAAEQAVKDEITAAEGAVDNLQEQIRWQKGYVSSLEETDSLYVKQIKILDRINQVVQKAAGAVKRAVQVVKDKLVTLEDELALNQRLQEEYKAAGLDTKALLQEELRLRKQIVEEKLKRGIPIGEELARISELGSQIEGMGKGFDIPAAAPFLQTINEMVTTTEKWGESIEGVKTKFQEGGLAIDAFLSGLRGEPPAMLEVLPGKINEAYVAGQKLYGIWERVAGVFDRLRNTMADPSAILPAGIPERLSQFATIIATRFPQAAAAVQTAWRIISSAANQAISIITGQVFPKLREAFASVERVMSMFGVTWADVFRAVVQAVVIVVAIVGAGLAILLGIVVGVMNGIALALQMAAEGWEQFMGFVKGYIDGLATSFAGLMLIFTNFGKDWDKVSLGIAMAIEGAYKQIASYLGMIASIVETGLATALGFIGGFVGGVMEFFVGLYNDLVGASIIPNLINDIVGLFGTLPELLGGVLSGLGDLIAKPFEAIGNAMGKMFGADIDFDPKAIINTLVGIGTEIRDLPKKWEQAINTILSSSKAWAAFLFLQFETIRLNFGLMTQAIITLWNDAMTAMLNTFQQFWSQVRSILDELIRKWYEVISAMEDVKSTVRDLFDFLLSQLNNAIEKVSNLKQKLDDLPREIKIKIIIEVERRETGGGPGPGEPSIPGAQGGLWRVPRTMLAMLHRGEAVLPEDVAQPFRAAFSGMAPLAAGMGGGGTTTSLSAPINIYNPQFTDEAAMQDLVNRLSTMLGQRVERLQRARGLTF